MTNFPGAIANIALSDFAGEGADRLYDPAVTVASQQGFDAYDPEASYADLPALSAPGAGTTASGFPGSAAAEAGHVGFYTKLLNDAEEWFEIIHVIPKAIVLGNVLTTVEVEIDIFNADRYEDHIFSDFENNTGEGTSIPDLPSLPFVLLYLTGIVVTYEVTPDGPPSIDGTLDFVFDLYTVSIPVSGQRIVMFPFRPELPTTELLRFLTDVIPRINASEQRIRLRKNPRQEFIQRLRLDGAERQAAQHLLYEWQVRVFGLPVWHEGVLLSAPISAGATTLPVEKTSYSDFRVGSLCIVFTDRKIFDAVNVAAVEDNLITLETPTVNAYPANTEVFPVRQAQLGELLRGTRQVLKVEDLELRFRVRDNDVDLASAGAFATLAGKVLLDDPNLVNGALTEVLQQRVYEEDSETGIFTQKSIWDHNRRGHQKGFLTRTRQQLWELRQLLHFLGGQLVPFYIPTFSEDLMVAAPLASGSPNLVIENVGYSQFVLGRKARIRVHLSDGTVLDRSVLSFTEVDPDTEQLSLDANWPANYAVDEVERIEYVELVRFDTDDIEITHTSGIGDARVFAPVREVDA